MTGTGAQVATRDDALARARELCESGNQLQALGRFVEAIDCYTQALQYSPQSIAARANRGNALQAQGRLAEALADMDAVLHIKPAFPEVLNNRGNILRAQGQLAEALDSYTQALALRPCFGMALSNRGKALLDLSRPEEAFESFAAALKEDANDGEALFGQASARLQLGRELELARAQFEQAAGCGIPRTEALVGQAAAWAGLAHHREAAACVEELLRLDPEAEYAHGSLLYSRLKTCDWRDLEALIADVCSRLARGRRASYPHSLLVLTDSPQLQLTCARTVTAHKLPAAASRSLEYRTTSLRSPGDSRLRIAYVSADFTDHPVPKLLIGTLERHDRSRFVVIGVSLRAGSGHAFEQRIRGSFDQWIDAASMSDAEAAGQMKAAGVDIAVDLMGYIEGMRLGIFAQRPAPVQVNYLGYAGTTGAPCMDYILADAVVIPRGEEHWYSEQVVRLPHCFLPNDDRREIAAAPSRAQAGLPDTGFVFCAFTDAYKINPPLFAVWMRLLRAVPGSVLWLRGVGADGRDALMREAAARGIEPQRLLFAPYVPGTAEHLARQGLADLYLDTLPYNAHSTACDALWAGVPVLTCTGRAFASRVAGSALTAAGVPELVTGSLADYEARALELARHPDRLAQLRARLARNRLCAPLFDTAGYTRALEAAYEHMYRYAAGGLAPQGFDVMPDGVCADRTG